MLQEFFQKHALFFASAFLSSGAAFFRALSKGKKIKDALIIGGAASFLGSGVAVLVGHFTAWPVMVLAGLSSIVGLTYDTIVRETEKTLTSAGREIRAKIDELDGKKDGQK